LGWKKNYLAQALNRQSWPAAKVWALQTGYSLLIKRNKHEVDIQLKLKKTGQSFQSSKVRAQGEIII
jgi:hypothetical protein